MILKDGFSLGWRFNIYRKMKLTLDGIGEPVLGVCFSWRLTWSMWKVTPVPKLGAVLVMEHGFGLLQHLCIHWVPQPIHLDICQMYSPNKINYHAEESKLEQISFLDQLPEVSSPPPSLNELRIHLINKIFLVPIHLHG